MIVLFAQCRGNLPVSYEERQSYLRDCFDRNADFVQRETILYGLPVTFYFFNTLAAETQLEEQIFRLFQENESVHPSTLLHDYSRRQPQNQAQLKSMLVSGNIVATISGDENWYVLSLENTIARPISEPDSERIIRGAHDGFIEKLDTNIHLLRYRLKDPSLTVEYIELGSRTNTRVAIVYIQDLVNDTLLTEVKRRLAYIDTDMIISPGYIEEFIEDNTMSFFPQLLNTERPDRVEGNIMEGRIALLCEGTPTALIAPATFFSFYQSPDDYNSRWIPATFIRLLRLFSFLIAITLPAFYISVIGFHLEVIPNDLIWPVKYAVEGIPYPPLIEALIMEVTIELIREAGIRLPSPISQTIGIVGGLVIGDAVVQAGLISNLMIVVVAITAISSFIVPSNEMSTTVRLLRFPLMVLAATFGFVGIVFGLIFILINLCKLETLGVPYFAPFAPLRLTDWKDTFVRFPLWTMSRRPADAKPKLIVRLRDTRGWKQE